MKSDLSLKISSLNAVAMGDKSADLILKNCYLVNVYSGEILPKTEIAIIKNRIAYVGNDATHAKGPTTKVMDLAGQFVTPGFADPHTHIDQFVLPSELAAKSILCGVTSIFSDPIDLVSVCGYKGFLEFVKLTDNLPVRFFHVVPGGLPVDKKFSHGRALSHSQEMAAVKLPRVVGMGEVFSWTKVTARDPKTMKSLSNMLNGDCIINGHTAGASDKKLNAYISSGILSCHEPINSDQVMERLRLGMWVMIREGSIRRDLNKIIPSVLSNKIFRERLMFCSDGLDPVDLTNYGHIDYSIRESVKLGLDQVSAIAMASKNCFDYYNMGKDLGGIAPGKIADILVFDDLSTLKPNKVFVDGKLVVNDKRIITKTNKKTIPKWMTRTVKCKKKFSSKDFIVKSTKASVTANVIGMKTELITEKTTAELKTEDGNVVPSSNQDVWKVAAFDRTFGSDNHTIGFLQNFGANIGAFASTWSFHENDMIVIGSNEDDMAVASNHLVTKQGGIVVVKNGKIISFLPLQLAGIISTGSFDTVYKNFVDLNSSLVDLGCKFKKPHLIPLFLPFLALPEIRILYSGLIDVKKRRSLNILN